MNIRDVMTANALRLADGARGRVGDTLQHISEGVTSPGVGRWALGYGADQPCRVRNQSTIKASSRIVIAVPIGPRRRGRSKSEPSSGGLMRGAAVARPQR